MGSESSGGVARHPARAGGLTRLLALVSPGLLVAATGVGAGDLATAAFTGSRLGVAVLWAVLLGASLKFLLNEGLARWQLATGETLLEGALRRLGRPAHLVFGAYLLLWSFFVGSALMSACGVAIHAIVPVFTDAATGKIVFGIAASLLGVLLVLVGGFRALREGDGCLHRSHVRHGPGHRGPPVRRLGGRRARDGHPRASLKRVARGSAGRSRSWAASAAR